MLTLRREVQGTLKLFVDTSKILDEKMVASTDGRRLGGAVPGVAPGRWSVGTDGHARNIDEKVSKNSGVKEAGHTITDFGKLACRKEDCNVSFQPTKNMREFKRRSGMCESLLEVWNLDSVQALRVCEERQRLLGDGGSAVETRRNDCCI